MVLASSSPSPVTTMPASLKVFLTKSVTLPLTAWGLMNTKAMLFLQAYWIRSLLSFPSSSATLSLEAMPTVSKAAEGRLLLRVADEGGRSEGTSGGTHDLEVGTLAGCHVGHGTGRAGGSEEGTASEHFLVGSARIVLGYNKIPSASRHRKQKRRERQKKNEPAVRKG